MSDQIEWQAAQIRKPTHTQIKTQASAADMKFYEYVQWMADVVSKMGLYPPKEVDRKEVTNV